MKRRFHPPAVEPSVNLTPLIDVVFVILIVFLITAPLLELEQVDIAQGSKDSSNKSAQTNSPIAVYVRQDNTVWFESKQREEKELIELLKEARKRYPNTSAQLIQDRRSQFGTYQSVKGTFEAAGFTELEVVLRPGA